MFSGTVPIPICCVLRITADVNRYKYFTYQMLIYKVRAEYAIYVSNYFSWLIWCIEFVVQVKQLVPTENGFKRWGGISIAERVRPVIVLWFHDQFSSNKSSLPTNNLHIILFWPQSTTGHAIWGACNSLTISLVVNHYWVDWSFVTHLFWSILWYNQDLGWLNVFKLDHKLNAPLTVLT